MNLLLVDDEWFTREGILDKLPWRQLGITLMISVGGRESCAALRQDSYTLTVQSVTSTMTVSDKTSHSSGRSSLP
ncbi:hypothetical protein [Paenibacillus sedimenti]|uniref:Uncharacterized protein n=1 Tax=Paenibacillus sedimenti TaxID=2770274 RepID=A0A926QJG4_9BACL|nr:hypothetical protein [Paenibacillus sedimenti]MBD0381686.1 hypothetical protein [Paenibacillus sedimenti]